MSVMHSGEAADGIRVQIPLFCFHNHYCIGPYTIILRELKELSSAGPNVLKCTYFNVN